MRTYRMKFDDNRETFFQCEPDRVREFVERMVRIYHARGLRMIENAKEVRS
jgi:hypothetical protein